MIQPGLCSITFRSLPCSEIVRICEQAKIRNIEWGSDVHLPVGYLSHAHQIGSVCREVGISTLTYGSYFRLGEGKSRDEFSLVLETAIALGASTIRVWPGTQSSVGTETDVRCKLVDEARSLAELAREASCKIGFEYHLNTLTDTNQSAFDFITQVDHQAAQIYWQPRQGCTTQVREEGLQSIMPWLSHLHVFHWVGNPVDRRPLNEGEVEWRSYFSIVKESPQNHIAFLEFVRNNSVDQFVQDAKTLRTWLEEWDECGSNLNYLSGSHV